jgi:16S rRNA (guanine966-N2)-methyltransferase
VRVIGGRFRGRRLAPPPGQTIRPTSDRVRESLFDILAHGRWATSGRYPADARVLDVFAGTGALGIEALSRGATDAVFIDRDAAACRLVQRNLMSLDASLVTWVLRRNAEYPAAPPAGIVPRTLAFLDPPYRSGLAAPALQALRIRRWLAEKALVVVELSHDEEFSFPAGFQLVDDRTFGETRLAFGILEAGTPAR